MSVIPDKYVQTILNNVALELGVKDYSYETKKFESIAQNYFGIILPVHLKCIVNNKPVDIHIVLKLAPLDERFRVSGAVTLFFAQEIFTYSEVLRAYRELQKSIPLSSQYTIPTLYYVCREYCKEAIVMENMCIKGYKPYSNGMFLDLNHIKVAIETLARFHALSMILQEKDEKLYNKAKEICLPLSERSNKRYMDILIDRLQKAKQKLENTSYVSQLNVLIGNCVKYVENAAFNIKCLCICHGDIWKENILFKYEDNIPVSACLIDFQTTRMCSPAFDLLYLIVSSTNFELRKIHFSQLIDTYYGAVAQTLTLAKASCKYSREILDEDLQTVGPSCFIVANTAMWLSSGLQEEGHVRSKIQWKTEEEKCKAIESYKNIVTHLIDDLTCYGYFQLN